MQLSKGIYLVCILTMMLASGGAEAQSTAIATVQISEGTVFVTRPSGKQSIVSAGSKLERGDTVNTEKNSYVRLKFSDGGILALRPNSVLQVNDYQFSQEQPGQDFLLMKLIKGGLRTLTGLISKRGAQSAYRLSVGTATVGIRGTEFVARVCDDQDCQPDKAAKPKVPPPPPPNPVVARIHSKEGTIRVVQPGQKPHELQAGDALHAGEAVECNVDAQASIIFTDGTRVVLGRGGSFAIKSYRYQSHPPEKNGMLTELLRGGLRAMTGLLTKSNRGMVKYRIGSATVGIRGTNFDMLCAPSGQTKPQNYVPSLTAQACDQALFVQTREGEIELSTDQHSLVVPKGRAAYLDGPGAIPVLLDEIPPGLRDNPAPQPESLEVDFLRLFGPDGTHMHEPGTYVEVAEGRIELQQQNGAAIELSSGETGFAGTDDRLFRLSSSPSFMLRDDYLRELMVDPASCQAD